MEVFVVRTALYLVVPVALGLGLARFDRTASSRQRRIEGLLITMFIVSVAGSGLGGFFGHVFLADDVAEAIGWESGSPFQTEVGFANLMLGLLGAVAAGRRDGFREATVLAVAVFGIGASITHLIDIVDTGNLAAGNTIQNIPNLARPAILVPLLVASRRAEKRPDVEADDTFDPWRVPIIGASVMALVVMSIGFSIGTATDAVAVWSVGGIAIGGFAFARSISRAHAGDQGRPVPVPTHED